MDLAIWGQINWFFQSYPLFLKKTCWPHIREMQPDQKFIKTIIESRFNTINSSLSQSEELDNKNLIYTILDIFYFSLINQIK
jgi:hypothetical protein